MPDGSKGIKHVNDLNDLEMKTSRLVLWYTLIFTVIAVGLSSVFLLTGKSFLQHGDGYRQGFFWIAELKHVLDSVLAGDGLPQWSWSKGLGMQYQYRADPFNLLASLFPLKYLEFGISLMYLAKLYLGGVAYLFLAREQGLSNYQCILGPILYVFSSWFINVMMVQGSFVFLAFMIPLVFLSIEWVYKGKSPLLFIATVAYFLIRDGYTAYMVAIAAVIYVLLRYFAYHDSFDIRTYFAKLGQFVLYAFISGSISSVFFIQFVSTTMGVSKESSHDGDIGVLYDPVFFLDYGKILMTSGLTKGFSYLGLPILALLALPLIFRRISLRNTPVLMSAILIVMMFFPMVSSVFNGFGYSTGRWYVIIVFFLSWATMQDLDINELQKRRNLVIMTLWLCILALWILGPDMVGIEELSLRSKAFVMIEIMAGIGLLITIGVAKKSRITIKHRQLATIAWTAFVLVCGWSMSFYLNQDKFVAVGEVNGQLEESTQKVTQAIDDNGFYRTDQVDWINVHQAMKIPANENLWWQSKSIYAYDSYISNRQLDYNRELGNNYGYLMRVYQLSNGNRMGMDFLYGVKYFLGDNKRIAEETGHSSDEYRAYGFEFMERIDGVNVFRNKYDPGLGFLYDRYIPEKEFLKLDRLEREQGILQAVVIPDELCDDMDEDMTAVDASDIQTDIRDVKYEVVAEDGLKISDRRIVSNKKDATFTIRVKDIKNCQLIASFDNLKRTDGKRSFAIYCDDGKIIKEARTKNTNQSLREVKNFDINIGYQEDMSGEITFRISQKGEYTMDGFSVRAMAVSNYDRYASERQSMKYEITSHDAGSVDGRVKADKDGILFLSIPQYRNWDVYVDGERVDRLDDINIAFTGVQVKKGDHRIALKYNNRLLKYSCVPTIIGLMMALCVMWYRRRYQSTMHV